MSNRLESLNSKKPGKPALKFKPKAVARKSKEDRDKNAPAIKTEESPRVTAPTRGRGGARGRGGRGRGAAYVGTLIVSAGPLASGSVSMGGHTSSKTGMTNDKVFGSDHAVTPLANLKLKNRQSKSPTPYDDESDEDDATRINMSKEYAFEDSETVLFPVRPQKDTSVEPVLLSVTALVNSSRAVTVDSVKSEPVDDVAEALAPTDPIEQAEHNKIIDDQNAIVDLVTMKMADLQAAGGEGPSDEDKYILFHIPQVIATETKKDAAKSAFASDSVQILEGQIGNMNFHKSGKITLTLGEGTVLNVTQGVAPAFLQEVFVVDSHQARNDNTEDMTDLLDVDGRKIAGNMFRLGEIAGKIIGSPAVV